jgi:broad specificity phosphatase PhoE
VWQVDDALVERSFGAANELQSAEHTYSATWEQDAVNVNYRPGGDGESVAMVAERLRGLFTRLEAEHQGRHILLVSHGDTLSICQAAMTPGPHTLHGHRQFAFNTAQLKRLN